MIGTFTLDDRTIRVDFSRGRNLAISLDPHARQPSFFAEHAASAKPMQAGAYVGAIQAGGSCNAEEFTFIPHCHGTHTEGIGHIQESADAVQACIDQAPCLALLVSVQGEAAAACGEDYPVRLAPGEYLVTRTELERVLGDSDLHAYRALIIRSLPNDPGKCSRDYAAQPGYPVLSTGAMALLAASPLLHLLVDMPSLDKADDGGLLANHHCWWGLDADATVSAEFAASRSLTEMIYVPDETPDGEYWMHLGVSPLYSDASPSSPVLFPVLSAS